MPLNGHQPRIARGIALDGLDHAARAGGGDAQVAAKFQNCLPVVTAHIGEALGFRNFRQAAAFGESHGMAVGIEMEVG